MPLFKKSKVMQQGPKTTAMELAPELYSKIRGALTVPDRMLVVGGVGLSMFADIGRSIPDIDIILGELSSQELKKIRAIEGLQLRQSPSDNYIKTHDVYKGKYKSVDVDIITNGGVIHDIPIDYMFKHSSVMNLDGVDMRVLDKSLLIVIKFLAATNDLTILGGSGLSRTEKDFEDIRAMLRAYYGNDPGRFIRDEKVVIQDAIGRTLGTQAFFKEFHRVLPGFLEAQAALAAAKPALERLKRGPAGRPDHSAFSQSL